MSSPRPVRVALLNDYEVVLRGLVSMLEPFEDRIEIVQVDTDRDVVEPVDVTLYDTFARQCVDDEHLDRILADDEAGHVVIFTWTMQPDLVEQALGKGVRGYLDKSVHAAGLAEALERVAAGELIVSPTADAVAAPDAEAAADVPHDPDPEGDWPGRRHGLSARESEILALITQGLTNEAIAAQTYLSINSVKTYIRNAYRKIGVERRAQAVRWGLEHDMVPPQAQLD